MATALPQTQPTEQSVDKGLKSGALGLISTTIIATASVAPAKGKSKTPGRAAILTTFILLVSYALVIFSMQSYRKTIDPDR